MRLLCFSIHADWQNGLSVSWPTQHAERFWESCWSWCSVLGLIYSHYELKKIGFFFFYIANSNGPLVKMSTLKMLKSHMMHFYLKKNFIFLLLLLLFKFGHTLLEGMCMRLTWHLHNHDMTYVMNMLEVLCMFGTTVIKCHSLSYYIFNANMTLFEMFLWHLDINQYIITCQCLCHDNLTLLRQHNLS